MNISDHLLYTHYTLYTQYLFVSYLRGLLYNICRETYYCIPHLLLMRLSYCGKIVSSFFWLHFNFKISYMRYCSTNWYL
jgi:hypothetical protein